MCTKEKPIELFFKRAIVVIKSTRNFNTQKLVVVGMHIKNKNVCYIRHIKGMSHQKQHPFLEFSRRASVFCFLFWALLPSRSIENGVIKYTFSINFAK